MKSQKRTARRTSHCVVSSIVLAATVMGARPIPAASSKPLWFVGQWILAEDEDGGPPGQDLDEFLADGRYIIYGPKCVESLVASYHVHGLALSSKRTFLTTSFWTATSPEIVLAYGRA